MPIIVWPKKLRNLEITGTLTVHKQITKEDVTMEGDTTIGNDLGDVLNIGVGGIYPFAPQTKFPFVGPMEISGDLTVATDLLKVDVANDRVGIGIATPSYPLHFFMGEFPATTPAPSLGAMYYGHSSQAAPELDILHHVQLQISGGAMGVAQIAETFITGVAPPIAIGMLGSVNNAVSGANAYSIFAGSTGAQAVKAGIAFAGTDPFSGGLFDRGIWFGNAAHTFGTGIDFSGATISGNAIKRTGGNIDIVTVTSGDIELTAADLVKLAPGSTKGILINTTGAKPAASVANAGQLFFERAGSGSRSRVFMCMESDAGAYNWVEIANGGA